MTVEFSRRLALVFGVGVPIVETIRRWHQLADFRVWPFWLDDYLLGSLLLYGAWRVKKDVRTGRRFLAAGWGFTCGMAYGSFFSQLSHLNEPDPAPIPSLWVAVIKGTGLMLATAALIATLRSDAADSIA
jgi:hypothetical protein